jgi:hypothetical protein
MALKESPRMEGDVASSVHGGRDCALGLDPGSTGLKKACVLVRRREVEVMRAEAARRTFVSFPASRITFRHFSLPLSDKKRLKEVIAEDLADSLPFPLEEMAWDFCQRGHGDIFAVAALKNDIREAAAAAPVESAALDAEPFAYSRAAAASGLKDCLVVDFGAMKTLFCQISAGNVQWVRVILKGGESLSQEISLARSLQEEAAESLKRTEGLNLPEARTFLGDLLGLAYLPMPLTSPVILVCGGGAALPGLVPFLEKNLHVSCELFPMPPGLSPYEHVVALGMALKGKLGEAGVALTESVSQPVLWKTWGVLLLLPVLLFSLNTKLHEAAREKKYQQIRQEMVRVVKANYPSVKKVMYPVDQFNSLLQEEKKQVTSQESDFIKYLEDLGKSLEGKGIRIHEMDLEENSFRLKGEAPSFDAIEKWRSELSAQVASAEIGEQKTTTDRKISFEMRLTLKKQ